MMFGDRAKCWQIEALVTDIDLAQGTYLPAKPGQATDYNEQLILHHAPNRWLAFNFEEAEIKNLIQPELQPIFQHTEITGYWLAIDWPNELHIPALSATQPIDRLLDGRDCALTTLFDCPAIILKLAVGFFVLVRSSYSESFLEVLQVTAADNQP